MTQGLTDARTVSALERMLFSDAVVWVGMTGWAQLSVSGGASALMDPTGMQIYIASGTNAYVVYGAAKNANWTFNGTTSNSPFLPWNNRMRLSVTLSVAAQLASTSTYRLVLGRANGSNAAPADLSERGIALIISGAGYALQIQTHNGTTLTTSGILTNLTLKTRYQILLDSSGGTLTCSINGTSVGSISGAPTTALAAGNYSDLAMSIADTGTNNTPQINVTSIRVVAGEL